MKTLLLDFNTIIDPVSLLSCLITFRQTHENIHVRDESLIYRYNDENGKQNHGIPNFGNLSDRNILSLASRICKRSGDDLSLQSNNLCLALRLFRHALDEGIISILDDTLMGKWAGVDKSVSQEVLRQTPSFEYVDRNLFDGAKYGSVIFQPDKHQRYDDLALSLKQYWDTTLGGRTFNPIDLITESQCKPFDFGYQGEVIHVLNVEEFSTYTTLIDNPEILPIVLETAKSVVEDQKYENKVRWFLPKIVLNKLSLGTYPLFEMLWIIIKREFYEEKKKDN